MKRLLVTLATTTLVLGGCTPEASGSQRKKEQNPDPIVELYTNVPDRCAPYTVSINIEGGEGLNPRRTWTIAGGKWTDKVVYKSGKRLTFTLAILDAKMNCVLTPDERSIMGCRIDDGETYGSGMRSLQSSGTVVCRHTTRR